jgi:hypothetical protein
MMSECRYFECRYAKCRYDVCHYTECLGAYFGPTVVAEENSRHLLPML